MKDSSIRFPPKWFVIGIFLLVWFSIWLCLFLFLLQPLGGIISQKYAALSGGIGLLLTLPFFGLMWLRPDKIKIPTRESIIRIVLLTFSFCIVIWLVVPLTRNILLAPITHINLNIQGEKSGHVDIIWLKSGFGDIPFQSIEMDNNGQIESESIRINLDENGQAELSWSGRAWKQVNMVMRASHPLKITSTIDNATSFFNLDQENNQVSEIILPVKDDVYYQTINLIVLPFFFIVVGYFLFLLETIFKDPDSPIHSISNTFSKIPFKPLVKWTSILIAVIYGMLASVIVVTGFFYRMYMDDFCYLNIYHQFGFFGAILNNYLAVNGRFAGHVLNFLAFSFGKASLPFGPLIAFLGVGASQFYLFNQLLNSKNSGENRSTVRFAGILFSIVTIVTASLMAPRLYESLDWTLHSIIITGSLFLLNFYIGLVLYFTSEPHQHIGQIGQALVFTLVGFCAMGFSEVASFFLLAVYILVVLILIVSKKVFQHWGLILGSILGIVSGIIFVAKAPATASRAMVLGFSYDPIVILTNLFNLVQSNFRTIFLENSGIGLIAFCIALVVGYTLGMALPITLKFERNFPSSALGHLVLFLMPFFLTIFTLLPSAIARNYLPLRTMFLPIYFLVIQYLIVSIYFGRRDSVRQNLTPFFLVFSSISVLVIGVIGLATFNKLAKQIMNYANEFDAREVEIFRAKNSGMNQIKLSPYKNQIGVDIPADPSNWYVGCLNEYYGMKLSLDE